MEIRYKRDLNSNYMILTEENPKNESYEVRMITENRIYGLLPCIHQQYEGRTEYYYEITGRQSMELLYERRKLNSGQLKGLLRELLRILESAGEYLLNPDHLLLGPETIYLHTRSEKLYLCCYPGSEKRYRNLFWIWRNICWESWIKATQKGLNLAMNCIRMRWNRISA